jgi:CxxC motif-containing protein
MEREMICISCPIGCHLTVKWQEVEHINPDSITIEGNKCPRGTIYGVEEILAPKRVVTATCAVNSMHMNRIPVKTDGAILKEHINSLLDVLYKIELKVPVKLGDTVIKDIKGSGINLVATRSLYE